MSRYSKTKEEYFLTFYGHHDSNELLPLSPILKRSEIGEIH